MKHFHPVPVLIVEDEPIVRLVACDFLADAGFEVLEAETAEEALDILNDRRDVQLVFTDVHMPGPLDGLDLVELVHQRWPNIQLVVTSGRGLAGTVPDHGRFLSKPYSFESMTALIENLTAPR